MFPAGMAHAERISIDDAITVLIDISRLEAALGKVDCSHSPDRVAAGLVAGETPPVDEQSPQARAGEERRGGRAPRTAPTTATSNRSMLHQTSRPPGYSRMAE
jgi:hypothetical protein